MVAQSIVKFFCPASELGYRKCCDHVTFLINLCMLEEQELMDHVYEMEIAETLTEVIYLFCFALFINDMNSFIRIKKRT